MREETGLKPVPWGDKEETKQVALGRQEGTREGTGTREAGEKTESTEDGTSEVGEETEEGPSGDWEAGGRQLQHQAAP